MNLFYPKMNDLFCQLAKPTQNEHEPQVRSITSHVNLVKVTELKSTNHIVSLITM